jgi:hypothetical protein
MMPSPIVPARVGAITLAVAAPLFLLYPTLRPWADESTMEGAVAGMGSMWWTVSHMAAMIGFILVALGLLALHGVVAMTRAARVASAAVVTTWIGAGLTLTYYGAETFGRGAIARHIEEPADFELLAQVDAERFGIAAVATFGLGLLLLAVGGVLVAVAVWRSGVLPRSGGVLFGLGYVLFLPQFFTPPAVRIAHGALLALGLVWLSRTLWRAKR